jgi:glycine/D-amino acid oxidase-like deaminating enzyme
MGHIVVMDDSEAEFALTHYSRRLWLELAAELPPEAEFLPAGTLWVAADQEEIAEVRRKLAFYTAHGVSAHELDSHALAEAEPNLRPGLAGGLLIPADAVVYPPVIARFLLSRATVRHARAATIEETQVRLEDGTTVSAGVIVNATGAAAPGVQPRKGHLLITGRYPGFVNHQLIELGYLKSAHSIEADSVAFNVQPRRTGQILIGSSRQYGNTDPAIDARMMQWMLERAVSYMPSLARLSAIRGWTGFRASTPDKLPLIGRCPGYRNVWLATGHEGLGITTSLGTAKLVAAQITGRPPAIPIEPYLPGRTHDPAAH